MGISIFISSYIKWWTERKNFEQLSRYLRSCPLRQAKGLIAFYANDMGMMDKLHAKLSKEQRSLY